VVTATGIEFYAERIVLTAGTFLGGKIHIGLDQSSGGRAGDPPSIRLAERLRELPFEVGRLKTGTPPRIDAKSVDFSVMTEQPGDTPLPVMSYWGSVEEHPQQVSCYITHTNEKTHDIIREGLDRSPMYTGVIEVIGPRYCPSIEDKIHRFADKNSHQIFIEPEGLRTHELYPNGVSTSLPFDIQVRLIQSMKGMGNAHIMRPGYAIEYDYFDPRGLKSTLETRCLEGLYFAGQINGTTGYEEAAAQGLLAGANAALAYQQKPSWSPKRSEAYLGVLVDDLISNGTSEPYRMFTSRAEHRLILREDNADLRLSEFAYQAGLLPEEKYALFAKKQDMVEKIKGSMESTWVQPESDRAKALAELSKSDFKKPANEFSLLKRPELKISDILDVSSFDEQLTQLGLADDFPRQVFEQIEIQAKYSGYIGRQEDEIKSMKAFENTLIPTDFDYGRVKGLSNEILSKLEVAKPETLAQASRVSGVTPAAISLIMIYLKKQMGVKLQKKTH
jgi:tRNA uridine 5-carboxymethylaminomethyl modification enzyme